MSQKIAFFALILLAHAEGRTKVGFILSSKDRYNDALKRVAKFAIADHGVEFELITEEYDGTMRGITQACCRLVHAQVAVVITKASSADTALQADFLSDMHIPIISVSATDPFLDNADWPYLLRMLPSEKYLGKAIYELAKFYRWPEIVVIATGNPYGVNGVMELINYIQMDMTLRCTDFMIIKTQNFKFNVTKKMQAVKSNLSKIIVVNVDSKYGKDVFDAAKELGLMSEGYAWIVTDAIASQPENLAGESGVYLSYLEGILGIRQKLEKGAAYNDVRDRYLLAGNREVDLSIYTLNLYDAIGLVNHVLDNHALVPYTELECMGREFWADGNGLLNAFRQTRYPGVVKHISFAADGNGTEYQYEVVNFVGDKFAKIGHWSSVEGIGKMSNTVVFPGGTRNAPSGTTASLVGTHLKLGTIMEEPFMIKRGNCTDSDFNCWSGIVNDIIERLSFDLGFTFEYLEPLDGKAGARTASGEWNGLVGELLSGRTDMIAIHFSVNLDRQAAMGFTFPFMDSGLHAVVKGIPENNTFFFLEPFTFFAWGAMFVLNYLVTILIWFYNRVSPFGKHGAKVHAVQTCQCAKCAEHRADHLSRARPLHKTKIFNCAADRIEKRDKHKELSLHDTLWTVGTGLVAQTGETVPYSLSGRTLLFSWWAFTLLMLSLYTAELTAYLTVSKIGTNLDSLDELLDTDSKYKWGVIGSRHPQMLLLNHNERIYNQIGKKAELLEDLDEAKRRFNEGNFVFIDETPVLQHNLAHECDAQLVGNVFQSFEYAFGLPKASIYKSIIDTLLLKYREEGFMETLWARWSNKEKECSGTKSGDDLQAMGLTRLAGLFYILIAGVGASCCILVIEFFLAGWMDSRRTETLTFGEALEIRVELLKQAMFGVSRGIKKEEDGIIYEHSKIPI